MHGNDLRGVHMDIFDNERLPWLVGDGSCSANGMSPKASVEYDEFSSPPAFGTDPVHTFARDDFASCRC